MDFDWIPHVLVIDSLRAYGIEPENILLIYSYLKGNAQFVFCVTLKNYRLMFFS